MGRFLLFLVAGASLGALIYGGTGNESRRASAERQAASEEAVLARGAAQSALDATLLTLSDDIAARPLMAERSVDSGSSSAGRQAATTGDSEHGSVRVVSVGTVGRARHVIEAEVLEMLGLDAAITIDAEEAKVRVKDDAVVTGHDHRVPSAGDLAGPAPSRTGIGFVDPATQAATVADWDDTAVHLQGASAFGSVPEQTLVRDLAEAALAGPGVTTVAEYELELAAVGSPTAPVVLHVTEKAKLREGAVGYGLLVVDGDLEMEKDARWEGLVVVRATARDKRKVKLKDEASVHGALVLLGEEFLEESGGSEGFPGGHMDLDLFAGAGVPLDREYHQHEWDDKYDLTYLDFLSGPDLAEGFAEFRTGHGMSPVRVEFMNAHNAAGTYHIDGATGRIEDGFDAPVSMAGLSAFRLDFDALCTLRGTNPGRVNGDGVDRDGSFTVRFWDGPTLVFAVSAYEHAKTLRDGSPTCGTGGPTTHDTGTYGVFELEVTDDARVRRSDESVGRLGRTIPAVRARTRAFPSFVRSVPTEPTPTTPSAATGGPVTLCHKPGTLDMTRALPPSAVSGHLGHGDTLGPCGG